YISTDNKYSLLKFTEKYFHSKTQLLKFQPKKDILQSYLNYFKKSDEWVRKEFFPHKEKLFPKKDLTNYKENYELKEMKPEYWDKIVEFIADIVKTKNKIISQKKQF
ncbi:acyl carrier protein, partial [Campylobacter lari]|nr:acyl carrier protein [Campylobacter lari]